jgi:hypothetical protein
MGLIIETDIGRDADDLFALLYFIGLKTKIEAILVSPGDHDQVAVVKAVLGHFGLEVPVLTPRLRISKESITPFHRWVIQYLGGNHAASPDGHEEDIPVRPIEHWHHGQPDVFICGPAKMAHLVNAMSITFQGGFVPYNRYRPRNVLDKFEGIEYCATFNLGGTKPAVAQAILDKTARHTWVGKNVCHTVVYTPEVHEQYCLPLGGVSEACRLHRVFVEKYMEKSGAKAFHDPLAATLMCNPELGKRLKLKPHKDKGRWSAIPMTERLVSNIPDQPWAREEEHYSLVDLVSEPWTRYFAGLNGVRGTDPDIYFREHITT